MFFYEDSNFWHYVYKTQLTNVDMNDSIVRHDDERRYTLVYKHSMSTWNVEHCFYVQVGSWTLEILVP